MHMYVQTACFPDIGCEVYLFEGIHLAEEGKLGDILFFQGMPLAVVEGSQPVAEGSQPAVGGSQPAVEDSQPAVEGSQPAAVEDTLAAAVEDILVVGRLDLEEEVLHTRTVQLKV